MPQNSTALPRPVALALRDELTHHVRRARGINPSRCELEQVVDRPFSFTLYFGVDVDGETERVVAKVIRHDPMISATTRATNQALVEYEVLERLHAHFEKIEGCAVPKPLFTLPEIEAYAMAFVEGPILAREMRRVRYLSSSSRFDDLGERFYRLGHWLAEMQRLTAAPKGGREALDHVRERCAQRLDLIVESRDPRIPPGFGRRVTELMDRCASSIEEESVPMAGRHGDFGPWNVIADEGGGVTVIDFMGFRTDPVLVDAQKMLVHLEDESRSLTTNPARARRLHHRFLDGLGKPQEAPLACVMACESMQRVVSLWANLSIREGLPHQGLGRDRRIRAHVAWLEEAHEGAHDADGAAITIA